jgi:hypothetical protein
MAKRFGVELKISRLLLNVGLLATRLKRFRESEQILRAIQAYRADIPQPNDFLALCLISQGHLAEAERELKSSLATFPEGQMSKALLGVVYRESGRIAAGDKLLQEVLDDGRCEFAMQLARLKLKPQQSVPADRGVSTSQVHRMYA